MKKILYSIILLFIWGCSSKKTSNAKTDDLVHIKQDITDQFSLKTSTVIDSFQYIILEKTEESLIGGIEKVQMSNDYIYISDRQNRLLQFDRHGKFINRIGAIGEGAGELGRISDFSIYDNKVWISDGWKILIYEMSGKLLGVLDYKKGESYKISTKNMEVDKNGIYLYNSYGPGWNIEKNSLMYLLDHRLLKVKHAYNILYNDEIHYANMMTSGHCLSKHNDGVLFYKFFNDTVYHLSGDGSMKKYAYDFGASSLSYHERKMLKVNNTGMYDIEDRIQGIYKTFVSDDYILTCFFYNTKHLWHYKNFETGESRLFTEFVDDLGTMANFFHFFEDKGKLISYIPTFILHSSNNLNPESVLGKLKAKTSANDNPIMVICTLK